MQIKNEVRMKSIENEVRIQKNMENEVNMKKSIENEVRLKMCLDENYSEENQYKKVKRKKNKIRQTGINEN